MVARSLIVRALQRGSLSVASPSPVTQLGGQTTPRTAGRQPCRSYSPIPLRLRAAAGLQVQRRVSTRRSLQPRLLRVASPPQRIARLAVDPQLGLMLVI